MPIWYQSQRNALLLLQSMAGVMIFGYSLRRRKRFLLRLAVSMLLGGALCTALQALFYIPGQEPAAVISHAFTCCATYAIVIGVVYACFRETLWTALFAASSGYIAQDLAGSFKQLFRQIPWIDALAHDDFGILAVDLMCYGGWFVLLFLFFRPYTKSREENFDNKLKAVVSAVVLLICIGMARLTQDNPVRNARAVVAESIYSMTVDALILVLQFGIMDRAKMSNRIELMREVMHQQYEQYQTSKESVQLINEKYHDLKHLLAGFDGVAPSGQVQKLREAVAKYDVRVQSGNEVLDVLLTQKMDLCRQRGIDLTCSLNHVDFGFMEEIDLFTLVNNALVNAISAASTVPESSLRYILMATQQDGNIVTIHVENSCSGPVEFEDGLPKTERDPRYHGFGMKSMMRTAEKYGGMLAAKQEGERFYLDVLLVQSEGT